MPKLSVLHQFRADHGRKQTKRYRPARRRRRLLITRVAICSVFSHNYPFKRHFSSFSGVSEHLLHRPIIMKRSHPSLVACSCCFSLLSTPASTIPNPLAAARRHHRQIPINIINLDKDGDRWETVTKELTSKGVRQRSITRYPAIYGKDLGNVDLRQNVTLLSRLFCTKGTIGCYLSHRNIWLKICQEK